jgi:hypothetical protein
MNDVELSHAVRRADPFAALSPRQLERLGLAALAGAERRLAPSWSRKAALAFALVLSSAALAAFARYTTSSEGGTLIDATRGGAALVPRTERPPAPPEPAPVPEAPVQRPAPVVRKPPPAAAAEKTDSTTGLGEEAELLLTALRQLRVDSDPKAALSTLDLYDQKFPQGALREDADAARREALLSVKP